MTTMAIVPGKPKMCLQENLVDCVDCGGLSVSLSVGLSTPEIITKNYKTLQTLTKPFNT